MNKKNLYELCGSDDDGRYDLLCQYGLPGEVGNPPAGGLSEEAFTGYKHEDGRGGWIVAHTPLAKYATWWGGQDE